MITLRELDASASVRDQLEDPSAEPVVLVNIFHVDPHKVDALLEAWKDDAGYMKAQPGFISSQLHQGIAGSGTLFNYAVWESVAVFRAAFANPEFQAKFAHYPALLTLSWVVERRGFVRTPCPVYVSGCSTVGFGGGRRRARQEGTHRDARVVPRDGGSLLGAARW